MTDCTWGDICTLDYGKALRGCAEEPSDENRFRVFGTNGPIGWSSQSLSDGPGVIVGRKGAYRGIHFSPEPFFVIDTAYYVRPKSDKLDLRWAYYKLLTFDMDRIDVGAAIPTTSRSAFYAVPVSIPSRKAQVAVAATLSAYDEMMENNRRRMGLLEESARLLYREWFVRLHFPGHEHVRITNRIPDGWERKPLAALCESIDYGYTASAEQEEVGPKFLRITDIVPDFIDWPAVPHCPIEDDRLEKFRLREGDIVIARTGATVGYAKRMHKRHPDAVFASYLVRLRLKPEADNLMVGVFVESEDFKSYVQSRVGGAAQPNANARVLAGAEILVPPPRIQRDFREFVEPLIDQREVLQWQNQKLRAARDLLLPRLMSGEITV
jgi:type I restriction enzyme S subunit